MPTFAKPKLLLPALVVVALLALPAGASATLAYVKNPFNATVFVAGDDGSGAHKVESGHNPHVAPNGLSVAYLHEGPKNAQELKIAPATGGPGKTVMANLRDAFYVAWSPDSKTLAALRGPELGKRKLVLIDVATGLQSVVATGYFSGFSFSPDGTEIAYAVAGSEKYPPRSDVFRFPVPIPGVVNVRAPEAVRLTSDHNWSASGNRLLAEFEGQDTSYAVVVNPKTGAQRPVAGTGETGFVGTDLSADGSLVLGFNGGFDPGLKNHKVQTVPYGGGKPKTLVKEAFEPTWSR